MRDHVGLDGWRAVRRADTTLPTIRVLTLRAVTRTAPTLLVRADSICLPGRNLSVMSLNVTALHAGIVAAATDNNVGVAGTAGGWNGRPGASLMILTTFGKSSDNGQAEAIVYSGQCCLPATLQ